ncbi:MAG TPA: GntR family transcriptional regulator [Candidatus Acidoferrum sp.]|nr:GntR family transcriptional regulator [Candidatus Acidoferrum sp.]
MTLTRFTLKPGESIFDQVVFAAQKSFLSGEYRPGQPFPSVRALATTLKIHPNTAHKVIQYLINERWLLAQPGIGTIVAEPPAGRAGDKKRLLQEDVEQLVVDAKRLGVSLDEVMRALSSHWTQLDKTAEGNRK